MRSICLTVINDLNYDQRMRRICTSLSDAGYEVTLVGRVLKSSLPLKNQPYRQKRLRCFVNKGKFFYLEYNVRLFFYLLFTKTRILCSIDLDTLLPGFLVSKLKGIPLVYDAHELFTEVPEVIDRPAVKKVWEKLESAIVPKLKYCYTVCDSLAEIFRKNYGVPFETIRNAPRLQNSPMNTENPEKALIYQGALNKGRGLEAMIMAMKDIDSVLWLVGEGDLSQSLRQLVKELQLENKVRFWGFVEPDRLREISRKAYIGINVSENMGLSYYYSLNNKFFDYMHAAIPSVTNKFPEYLALNKQYEISLMADCTPQSLAAAVNRLLDDEMLYRKLKQNCMRAKEVFNWENEEKKLLEFYARIP